MKNINDYKMAGYGFIVSCLLAILKTVLTPSIPTDISFGIAIIFILAGIVLSFWEIKDNNSFFYGFSENWNGLGIINSGFIMGISIYFLSPQLIHGIMYAFFLAIFIFIERLLIRHLIYSYRKSKQ